VTQALRVGLDARLVGPGLGIATYITNLAAELVAHEEVGRIVWFGAAAHAPGSPRVEVVAPGPGFPYLESRAGMRRVAAAGVDVMHFTANTGWAHRGPVPVALTIHDTIFLDDRGRTLRQRLGRTYMQRRVPRAARAADRVITVSASTAEDLRARGIAGRHPPEVIHHGFRAHGGGGLAAGERRDFVCFSGVDPRKNVRLALEAFAGAQPRLPDGTRLVVLAGAGMGAGDRERAAGLRAVQVRDYLPAAELQEVIGSARGLLLPTLAEGFGLPALEAMSVGTPVVGGLTAATREVAADALLEIDRDDAQGSLARWIERLAGDDALVAQAGERGRARAAGFTWEAAAGRHVAVYRALAGSRRP
jgi:glycosyltransferase involved in cell wall biosynthesis